MEIDFGQISASEEPGVAELRNALEALQKGYPKAALDHLHDASAVICEKHKLFPPIWG